MAAYVVAAPAAPGPAHTGMRLEIFPGSATPTVFPAGAPFWIGYGFVADGDGLERELPADTRFELEVDGARVAVEEEVVGGAARSAGKRCVARFESGLPAGWHRLSGRWYDAGVLVLTSDTSIEFVER